MLFLELLTMLGFGMIAHQDFKERAVLWVLFPILAVLLALLHLRHMPFDHFAWFALLNMLLVSLILLVLWAYTKHIMQQKFLNTAFGLGDMLFLYAFALGFPTVTFIVLLVGALCFSILAYLALKPFMEMETVPLAGLMGIFLIGVLVLSHLPDFPSLYII
ncbi:hypothetical protein [Allomuricauda sp. SCSIO 65647]|uniref:hypothetical protein n=1 Tax=Allomuricauda sp. SCSIO 65647 TaxID=2908843 RepID=UPI001F269F59|nr:hypothetical protein [Muricauda sp. SCSIO 65647]UJH68654.1 hypothetical protein L0P89_05425 [Muricauda sp. SCSIO 65647]